MNTNKYKVFLTVIDCMNLTRAAEKLNYSQPAISHVIRSMEDEFGFTLLQRTHTRVMPTKEAEILIPRMREIINHENSIYEDVNLINNIENGKINLGIYNSAMQSFMPQIINDFMEKHPGIEIELIEGNRAEIDNFLKNRIADFAVVSKFDYPDYEFIPIMEDELRVVIPINHPLADHEVISPEELFHYPILATEEFSDQDLVEISRIHEVNPNIKMRAKQESSLLKLAACGMGVCIIPNLYLSNLDKRLTTKTLDSPHRHRQIGIATISIADMSPACRRFVDSIPHNIGNEWMAI